MSKEISAVIAVDVVAGSHKEVYQFIEKEIKDYLKETIVVFGKPDILVCVNVSSLSELASVVTVIANHSSVAKTDTKVCVPKEMLQ